MRSEREHLLPLTSEGFELAETGFPVVDGQGCVKVPTNRHMVSLRAGSRTQARLLPASSNARTATHAARALFPFFFGRPIKYVS